MYLILTDDKELIDVAKNRSLFIGEIDDIRDMKKANDFPESTKLVEISNNQACNTELAITKMMKYLGIPSHISGYLFLRHVYSAFCKNPQYIEGGYTKLYAKISRELGDTSPSRVERAIRHATEIVSEKNPETTREIFGNALPKHKSTPENSMFISTTCRFLVENFL
ncbi:MAG: sporulation initiation factor Spo0A C-terminal domain-containing protein [Clostridia bacterium]|nr:sporulation initiation factor Spo0A C-terminal domain-containing protein [Clostridia bacterium]MDD4375990.1 sporulation initiation factor Spo0A C-terminal domain-containing protein [Clostridia bacterium]